MHTFYSSISFSNPLPSECFHTHILRLSHSCLSSKVTMSDSVHGLPPLLLCPCLIPEAQRCPLLPYPTFQVSSFRCCAASSPSWPSKEPIRDLFGVCLYPPTACLWPTGKRQLVIRLRVDRNLPHFHYCCPLSPKSSSCLNFRGGKLIQRPNTRLCVSLRGPNHGSVILSEQTRRSLEHLHFTAKKVLGSGGFWPFLGSMWWTTCPGCTNGLQGLSFYHYRSDLELKNTSKLRRVISSSKQYWN